MKLGKERSVMIVSSLVGIVVGYISFLLNAPLMNIVLALIVLAVMDVVLSKALKVQEKRKWWLGNSDIAFILVWFVSWSLFFNVLVR